jgi:hypothetical protein
MKNPIDVLRMKEQEILKIKVEIEALRITARLLSDDIPSSAASQRQEIPQLVEMP